MTTIVYLHAHPDDEASATAGAMARASARGDRVVVVYATNGDHGAAPDPLPEGDTVVTYRRREAEASAKVTGTARVEWLGYADSGMAGWEQNDEEGAFTRADVDEAARKVAAVLDEEDADVLVGYDWHGGYGHPDHVAVHHVAHRAAGLAARRPRLLETTVNRDAFRRMVEGMPPELRGDMDPDAPMADGEPMGTPEAEITFQVDVRDLIETKRAALACHASQVSDVGMMLAMPEDVFREAFGLEHYIEPGADGPMRRVELPWA